MERCSEGWLVVEVAAAFGLPLPSLAAVAGAAFAGSFDLGGGELKAGPDLIGLDLGHRPLLALGGFPAALAEPAGDHDPVTLRQRVGQVLGLAAPHVDLEERGLAVTPLTILLEALGHGDPQVGDRDAGIGEAELGGVDQVAGDGGLVVCCHALCAPSYWCCGWWVSVRGRVVPDRAAGGWSGDGPGGWRRRPGSPGRPAT